MKQERNEIEELFQLIKNTSPAMRRRTKNGKDFKSDTLQWNKDTALDKCISLVFRLMMEPSIQADLRTKERKILKFFPDIGFSNVDKKIGKLQLLCVFFLSTLIKSGHKCQIIQALKNLEN